MSLPILYGEASTGKTKMWSVFVTAREGAGVITVTHGYVDGKKQINERLVTTGKNIGRKNETTPLQQATNEAEALWKKKQDGGYAPLATGAATGTAAATAATTATGTATVTTATGTAAATAVTAVTAVTTATGTTAVTTATGTAAVAGAGAGAAAAAPAIESVPLPMLAQDFNKRGKSMPFPCLAQRKLDGVRCVAISGRGLFSRNGKPSSPHLTHIVADVNKLPAGTILDGELYSDDLTFQEIVGLVKKATLKAGDAEKVAKIYLCVYDTIRDGTNAERNTWLTETFAANAFTALKQLPTVSCESIDAVKELHASYVAEGYEGLILRNAAGLYKIGHRSTELQKYKEFLDSEYPIVGFKEGDGIEKGCVIWVCTTPAGQEFSVRPRGTREDRIEMFKLGSEALGKRLSVRYQELTTDGIPRFPVGISIRDYE